MKKFTLMGAPLLALLAFGCGGGGSSAASGGGAGTARATTYVTDSINTDYDQVWVTIYHAELTGADSQVLFDDPAGRVVDLKTLRDATGPKFSFLESSGIKKGSYQHVLVTLDKNLSLVPKATTTAESRQFSNVYDIAGSAGKVQLKFDSNYTVSTDIALVIDFDLAKWDLAPDGKVLAFVKKGDDTGLDDHGRHSHDDFGGTVASLSGTAPTQTFTLNRKNGMTISVQTDSNTAIFNRSGAANPSLANAQKVEVSGSFANNVLKAVKVKIEDEAHADEDQIRGVPTVTGSDISVHVTEAHGFVPGFSDYAIVRNAQTTYRGNSGNTLTEADFLAALATASDIEVEGKANADGTFTAKKMKIEDADGHDEVEVNGGVTSVGTDSLVITLNSWSGASLSNGASLTVQTAPATTYRLGKNVVTKAAFFAGVSAGSIIEAEGSLSGTTLTAKKIKTDD